MKLETKLTLFEKQTYFILFGWESFCRRPGTYLHGYEAQYCILLGAKFCVWKRTTPCVTRETA